MNVTDLLREALVEAQWRLISWIPRGQNPNPEVRALLEKIAAALDSTLGGKTEQ